MPSNPKKGKTLKCTENLKEFYENEDEFKFPEGGSLKQKFCLLINLIIITDRRSAFLTIFSSQAFSCDKLDKQTIQCLKLRLCTKARNLSIKF